MSISFVRWQPWTEMEAVRHQLNQLIEEVTPITRHSVVTSVNRAVRTPAIELFATETDVILRAEVPGVEGKDLDIQVTREAVSIKGALSGEPHKQIKGNPEDETKGEPEGKTGEALDNLQGEVTKSDVPPRHLYRSEFPSGMFHRVVPLPIEVDPENDKAEIKNGILTLTLPKRVSDRYHTVKVTLESH